MIIVTGAGSGIGEYLFTIYNQKEESVFGTCHRSRPMHPRITRLDIDSMEEVQLWANSIILNNSTEITLLNCAGVSNSVFLHKSDPEEWKRIINTNVVGTYNVIRSFLPHMRAQGFGRIINFSSVVAEIGVMGTSAYATSKSALWGLTRALAVENASKKITINCINLGYCNIGMGINEISEEQKKELLDRIPAKRFCTANEIFKTVEYLRCVEYVNGANISLNGALA